MESINAFGMKYKKNDEVETFVVKEVA